MTAVTFDTLKYANTLKEAGIPSAHAEAETKALSEVLEVNLNGLATKEDITLIRKDMDAMEQRLSARFDAKIAESKAELVRWVVGVGMLQITLIAALMLRLAPG